MSKQIGIVRQLYDTDCLPTNNIKVIVRNPPIAEVPEHVYVELCDGEEAVVQRYRRDTNCSIRLEPMSGYHCSRCGELVTLYDANDMLKRVQFCPCCGARNKNYMLDW